MKKRILLINEASFLSSGYAIYGRHLLQELYKNPNYEIAELGIYGRYDNPKIAGIPWRFYPNEPGTEEEKRIYEQNAANVFGSWKFESVCLDFKPHYVLDIRDYWMLEFESRSPFRPYYNWIIMPTVDAENQKREWLDVYSSADAVLTYQDWSGELLEKESGNSIIWHGAAPPAANKAFVPFSDRENNKKMLGFHPNDIIVGTVMRNQRRKLYPDLFKAFRKFLDTSNRQDVILYCHTSFPDMGWDIPDLLKRYELTSKVFFTYVCQGEVDGKSIGCGSIFSAPFQDAVTVCPQCKNPTAGMAGVRTGIPDEALATIYNIFDLYVQYANSEGFGMPQTEAAACGVPVMSTDYSAMSDIVRKLEGYPLKPGFKYTEPETGCFRVHPSEKDFVNQLISFVNLPQQVREHKRASTRLAFEKYYNSWEKTAQVWIKAIENTPIKKDAWERPGRLFTPAPFTEKTNRFNNKEYAQWLIKNVLGEPDRLNSYMQSRIIRDLNYGVSLGGLAGKYYNDSSTLFERPTYSKFDREIAYKQMVNMCNNRNHWEQKRCER